MPIYDYRCQGCGEEFELLVSKSRVAVCPACGSLELDQLPPTGIAVSSAASRRANFETAQRALNNAKDYRDQKIAHLDEIREHAPELLPKKKTKDF